MILSKLFNYIVTLPKTLQKNSKLKKNGQFVLENQHDLKPEKHTKMKEKKIQNFKNGRVTRHLFSRLKCTNKNRTSLSP